MGKTTINYDFSIEWLITLVLTIVFVILKLVDKIDWSWWWVLSPLWIFFGLFAVVLLVIIAIAVIGTVVYRRKRTKK